MKKALKLFFLVVGGVIFLISLVVILIRYRAPEIKLSASIPAIDKKREAHLISAFFGLDNQLPWLLLPFPGAHQVKMVCL